MIEKFSSGGKVLILVALAAVLAGQVFAGYGSVSSYASKDRGTSNPVSAGALEVGPRIFASKGTYLVGESVTIGGEGFSANELVRFAVGTESKKGTSALVLQQWDVFASRKGTVSTTWDLPSDGSFVITATGDKSGKTASTTVSTDQLAPPAVALEQCSNGTSPANDGLSCVGNSSNAGWVTGNVNGSKAQYAEDQFIPYRMIFTDLTPGTSYSFTLGYDITKAGQNAVDYIGNYNYTVTNANPCANGTSGTPYCTLASPSDTFPVPFDNASMGGPGNGGVADPRDQTGATPYPKAFIPGSITAWNADITGLAFAGITCASGTYPTGTCSQGLKITFTASASTVVLAAGAHIAPRTIWGVFNGAVGISGSPYHGFKVTFRDETNSTDLNVGSGDIQLAVDAVTLQGTIQIYKHASPPSPYSFSFSADFDSLGYTSGTPITGVIDSVDDPTHTLGTALPPANNVDPSFIFQNLLTFGFDRTVTETDSGPYSIAGASCATTVSAGIGTSTASFNGSDGVVINLAEGDTVVCTFFNSFLTAADAVVQGRVYDPNGFALKDAWVSATDNSGQTRYARTNQFGYYKIDGIESGSSLYLDVAHKSYTFTPLLITPNDAVNNYDFFGSAK